MIKEIKDFKHYYIDEFGNVYSDIKGYLIKKKPWLDSNKRYYMIGLSKNGKVYKKLIHRLVAETFIPNPNNKKVVNHINHNCQDNYYLNLEWVTTQENIHHSYSVKNQYRNEIKCCLFVNDIKIKNFPNIISASRYASDIYKASFSGMCRNMKSKNCRIERCND